MAFFTDKQQRQLQQIKSQICLFTDLDVGLTVLRVKGKDEDDNDVSGAQIILQQMDYETRMVKRVGYLVTTIEMELTPVDVICSNIVKEWDNYDITES